MDIYTVSNWDYLVQYSKNNIVVNGSYYYYAKSDHVSDASAFINDLNDGKWGGLLTYNGETRPFFFWKPSYNYTVESVPKVKSIKFGDGYEQNVADGINNILLTFNFNFDERDLLEHTAIIHFLHQRAGVEKFFFIPPQPYGVIKKFLCQEWNPTQNFVDNYSLTAKFREVI